MKPIKVSSANHSNIQRELDRVNGRATNSVMSSSQVSIHAAKAESSLLELVGLKKYACGAKITAHSGQPVARSYDYRRVATRIKLERRSSGWWITDISRITLNTYQGGETAIFLTPVQDQLAISLLRARYCISKPAISRETSTPPSESSAGLS